MWGKFNSTKEEIFHPQEICFCFFKESERGAVDVEVLKSCR